MTLPGLEVVRNFRHGTAPKSDYAGVKRWHVLRLQDCVQGAHISRVPRQVLATGAENPRRHPPLAHYLRQRDHRSPVKSIHHHGVGHRRRPTGQNTEGEAVQGEESIQVLYADGQRVGLPALQGHSPSGPQVREHPVHVHKPREARRLQLRTILHGRRRQPQGVEHHILRQRSVCPSGGAPGHPVPAKKSGRLVTWCHTVRHGHRTPAIRIRVLPLSYQLKNLIRGMLEPVATLRSSMARVFRHPWVQMFPTAMAEVEARARHVAEARRVKQASPLKLMPRQHTGRAMHDEEELTGTSERGSKNASAIDQLEQRAAGTTGTSTSTTSSKTKKSTGREQRAGGTTGTSTSTTSSKTKKSTGRRASIASVHTAGSQQSTTSQDTSLENREPGRQKAKEDIAIKDIDIKNADRDDSPGKPADNLAPEAEPSNKDDAETSATSATSRQSGLAPSVSHGSEAPGSNISEDKLEDTSGGSTLADSVEDDLSSILRDVYSSGGEASSVADRCTCKGLDNEELDSHYEGCPCASKNGKPAMIIKPLPMPPKDFKPKGIMKL
ncbi:uncharacterized protein [Dermacentor albipictus]|uniref:uncharacterized protein isoform X4 n=1 Tax=Dermacentor albipictus TaxID=60249 RepID=UPI0031FD5379